MPGAPRQLVKSVAVLLKRYSLTLMLQVGGDRYRWDLRTVGWCTWGCLFAVTAATFCFRFEPTLRPLLEMGWSPDEALKVPFWIASQLAIKVLQLMMRRFLYCTWPLKMPEQDYEFLVGDRSGWTPGKNEIHYYHETYGEQTIKLQGHRRLQSTLVSFGGQLLEVVLVSRSRFQSSGDVSFGADV